MTKEFDNIVELVRDRPARFIERMPPCHVQPFIQPGVVIDLACPAHVTPGVESSAESCDYCGSPKLEWRKCKLICADCRQINKSCADL